MNSALTLSSIATLSGIMLAGALIPSVSALTVSARSAAFGFAHGFYTSLGVVVGDIFFILFAIYGLTLLSTMMGGEFVIVKYLGGAYLIWLGISLWTSKVKTDAVENSANSLLSSSFMTGLLITLGDQKAVLFYLGLLPAILDLSAISFWDTGLIVFIAAVTVGGPKLVYAYLSSKAGRLFKNSKPTKIISRLAGGVMLGAGVLLILKTSL